MQVENLDTVLRRIESAGWPIFVEPEEKWYRAGDIEIGVRQFLVQDPDGYLLRLQQEIGERPVRRARAASYEAAEATIESYAEARGRAGIEVGTYRASTVSTVRTTRFSLSEAPKSTSAAIRQSILPSGSVMV